MKTQTAPKKVTVKALRGFQGEDGKLIKAGATVEISRNLARVVVLAGRAEYSEAVTAGK